MTEILDVSRDRDTGEITQFLILENGQPKTKVASPENLLLYDPAEELPFDGGMYDFLSGEHAIELSDDIVVAFAGDEYSYIIEVKGSLVETTPSQAEQLLQGVYDAIVTDDLSAIKNLHHNIIKNQVRRNIVNALYRTFPERKRIEIAVNGWLIDDFYLVDWNANMYAKDDDPDSPDYVRQGGEAVKKDTSYELVRLRHHINSSDVVDVTIDGTAYTLTEREMLFLAKVQWLLHRNHYHPDKAFWSYTDKWATIESEEPDLDVFEI